MSFLYLKHLDIVVIIEMRDIISLTPNQKILAKLVEWFESYGLQQGSTVIEANWAKIVRLMSIPNFLSPVLSI